MSANNSTYTWDETPRYDLTTAIVNTFLKELFGNFEFFTNVRYFQVVGFTRGGGDGSLMAL